MISELAVGYSSSNKNYLSVMEVNRSDISKNEFSVSARAIRLIVCVPIGMKACFGRCTPAPRKAISLVATRAKHASHAFG